MHLRTGALTTCTRPWAPCSWCPPWATGTSSCGVVWTCKESACSPRRTVSRGTLSTSWPTPCSRLSAGEAAAAFWEDVVWKDAALNSLARFEVLVRESHMLMDLGDRDSWRRCEQISLTREINWYATFGIRSQGAYWLFGKCSLLCRWPC